MGQWNWWWWNYSLESYHSNSHYSGKSMSLHSIYISCLCYYFNQVCSIRISSWLSYNRMISCCQKRLIPHWSHISHKMKHILSHRCWWNIIDCWYCIKGRMSCDRHNCSTSRFSNIHIIILSQVYGNTYYKGINSSHKLSLTQPCSESDECDEFKCSKHSFIYTICTCHLFSSNWRW